ncbi:hypothetical protein FRC11_001389, partial [Ceratobasidium sp. 423]
MAEVEAMEAAEWAMGVDSIQDVEIQDAGDDTHQFGGEYRPQDNTDDNKFLRDIPTVHILTHVTKAKGIKGDSTKKILMFMEF